MYLRASFTSLATYVATALLLIVWVFAGGEDARARQPADPPTRSEPQPSPRPVETERCTCRDGEPRPDRPWSRPHLADLAPAPAGVPPFDRIDEIAALEALDLALNEVGDGASYVWQRRNGRLGGVVQPTGSFKDRTGSLCRHVVIMLTAMHRTRRIESIACRRPDGVWQLDG